jgi:hypothetical protein
MDLRISAAADGDDHDLVSLYHWFAHDASVTRHGGVSLDEACPRPGPAGGTRVQINATLRETAAVAGLGSLVIAFNAWRGTRDRPLAIMVRYGEVTVTLTDGSEQEVQPLLDALIPAPRRSHSPVRSQVRREHPEVTE